MTLLEEIQSKCTPEELASPNCHTIAATVNVGRVKTVKTPIEDVQAYLQTNGLWWAIKAVAADTAHPATVPAQAIIDVANARYQNIDMSLPIVDQMLTGLVSAAVITAAQKTELMTLGQVPDPVTWEQVQTALVGA